MFAHPSDKPVTLPAVTVNDRALVLSLSQSDNQTVWRFDLDSLIEHGFRVTGREGFYDLAVTDLNGTEQVLARFLDKNEAHRILADIHDALTRRIASSSHDTHSCAVSSSDCAKRGWFRCFCGWLTFWRVLALAGIALLLYVLLRPFPDTVPVTGAASNEPPASGVPLDADQLLQ